MSATVNGNTNKKINIGVVGATGVVGETFLNLIEERDFPFGEIRLFASENSLGLTRHCGDQEFPIQTLTEGCFDGLDLVFFSSGDDISAEWAPKAMKAGAYAVDNSAAFRMNEMFHLVVPEVNGDLLPKSAPREGGGQSNATIIANPNCSTIQLVVALAPLAKKFGLKAVRVASYQSVSGAGRNGIEELLTTTRIALEGEELTDSATFPAPIAFNCIPQIGSIDADGYCTEEIKIMKETAKILRQPKLPVSAFTVRVPTLNAHAEAVWATLEKTRRHSKRDNCCPHCRPGNRRQLTRPTSRLPAADDRFRTRSRVHRPRPPRPQRCKYLVDVGRLRQPPQRRCPQRSSDRRAYF